MSVFICWIVRLVTDAKLLLFLFNSLPGFVVVVWESLVCLFIDFMESILFLFFILFFSRGDGVGNGGRLAQLQAYDTQNGYKQYLEDVLSNFLASTTTVQSLHQKSE